MNLLMFLIFKRMRNRKHQFLCNVYKGKNETSVLALSMKFTIGIMNSMKCKEFLYSCSSASRFHENMNMVILIIFL